MRRREGSNGAAAPGAGRPEAARADAEVGRAAEALRRRLEGFRPRVAVTLGSGLGGLVDRFRDSAAVPTSEVPAWPVPTVEGHAGRVVAGRLAGVEALGLSGRVHAYEGDDPDRVAFYVRVLGRLGVPLLVLGNAAGAVARGYRPGELMLVSDHLDLTGRSPLRGRVREGEVRFPDLSDAYDPGLRERVRREARSRGVRLREGVYAGLLGPSYETPAEIRMLRALGADAVGMSTVPEVLVARALGIRCVAVSCLTNPAAGLGSAPLRHEDVLEATERAAEAFQGLVEGSIRRFAEAGEL